jgi:hypothetical protein
MNSRFSAAILVLSIIEPAAAADWRVLTTVRGDNPSQVAFIDEESVLMKDGIMRVWIQYVDLASLKVPKNDTPEAATFEKAVSEKVKAGYIPELVSTLPNSSNEQFAQRAAVLIEWEVLVATSRYRTTVKYSVEIDCAQRLDRVTSLYSYKADDSVQASPSTPDARFEPIAPDSIFDSVRKRYCPRMQH